MGQKFSNNATALLISSISSSSTSFIVEADKADLFPVCTASGDYFKATLENQSGNIEIIKVNTRIAGSNIFQSVVRAQDGTTALAFSVGSAVELRVVASDVETALGHVSKLSGAHNAAAIAIAPTGAIVDNNVQSVISALDLRATAAQTKADSADVKSDMRMINNQTLNNVDLNSVVKSGAYRVDVIASNAPVGAISSGQLLVIHGDSDTISQLYFNHSNKRCFHRSGNPGQVGGVGSWGAWSEFWHTFNFNPDEKLNLTGGTLTGTLNTRALIVRDSAGSDTSSMITMRDDESPNGQKHIHANSNLIGFLNGAASWAFYVRNDGYIWCSALGWVHEWVIAKCTEFKNAAIAASNCNCNCDCAAANCNCAGRC